MSQPKRILICPLEWGLGHATRCIPIIRSLLAKDAEVIIAADGRPYELLKKEFPELELIRLKGYSFSYPLKGSMIVKMLISVPSILKGIRLEHRELQRIVERKKIDVVISDNRFGCYGRDTKNIFITHQLMIKSPFGESTLKKLNTYYIDKYSECWIPDHKGKENLAGDLSHVKPLPKNVHYIGPLSRFTKTEKKEDAEKYDLMAIISGPEPQRTLFEEKVRAQLLTLDMKALIVAGTPESKAESKMENGLRMVPHLGTEEMQEAIANSEIILARSGYSTIMDLAVLGKKAILIPTPGQTEQEYLAKLFMQKGIAFSMSQKDLDLKAALKESEKFSGFSLPEEKDLLEERLIALLS